MRKFATIFFLIVLCINCKTFHYKKSKAKIIDSTCIVIYEFLQYGMFYTETQSLAILKNRKIPFFDIRNFNSSILYYNPDLQNQIGLPDEYNHFVYEPDSLINLNFSSFKKNSFNTHGTGTINSNHFYIKKADINKLYIAFNLTGQFVYYSNLKNLHLAPTGRFETEIRIADGFLVILKAEKLTPMSKQQLEKFDFIKANINEINIFYDE